jgi:hypothetical protein
MTASRSVPAGAGWTITERGRLDVETAPTCDCNPRLAGLLIECPECGTVYGSLRDSMQFGQGSNGFKGR